MAALPGYEQLRVELTIPDEQELIPTGKHWLIPLQANQPEPSLVRSARAQSARIAIDSSISLPALRSCTETRDFDSTDPAQTNADFDHPLRVTADGQYVIAEAYGPGARLGMELEPKISTNRVGISQKAFLTPCR